MKGNKLIINLVGANGRKLVENLLENVILGERTPGSP